MLRLRRFVFAISLSLCCVVSSAFAQILNSERIEQTFGSYGIEVLYSDNGLRLSNLYSEHAGDRVTRTFAIVAYPPRVEAAFATQHEAILAGGSIGATFEAAGWQVTKSMHMYFSSSAPELCEMMGVEIGTPLATHAYRLTIGKDGARFEYAWIIEIHHPDYLSQADLVDIYGAQVAAATRGGSYGEAEDLKDRGLRLLADASTFGE